MRRLSDGSPEAFRTHIRIDPAASTLFADVAEPWQLADFEALDAAWRAVAGVASRDDTDRDVRRAWIERPRGHAKTADMAVQLAWALLFAKRPLRGVAAAADREQANLIADAVRTLAVANPGVCDELRFRQNAIENPQNGCRLDLISSDIASSFGLTPDFVICDELSHWPNEGLWHSLASAAAKKPHCLLAVLTNAGVGRGWQWQIREAARTRPEWYFSTLEGPHAPWIKASDLEEQRAILPASVYDRLWNNRWQDAAGDFLTSAEVAACRDERLAERIRGRAGVRYVAAIDYAEKQDLTAAVLLHREADRLVVDRLDVAVPKPDAPTLVAWVENWITRTATAFPATTFVIDEHQLVGAMQRFGSRYRFIRFPFAGGKGNHDLAMTLRRLIVNRQLAWYVGCGASPDDPADDLETELASLVLRQATSGRVRFDHPSGGHDDRAFALGAAAWQAMSQPTSGDHWKVTPPKQAGLLGW